MVSQTIESKVMLDSSSFETCKHSIRAVVRASRMFGTVAGIGGVATSKAGCGGVMWPARQVVDDPGGKRRSGNKLGPLPVERMSGMSCQWDGDEWSDWCVEPDSGDVMSHDDRCCRHLAAVACPRSAGRGQVREDKAGEWFDC
jgi:hypothetical protein